MNMHSMKDECLTLLVLFASVLVADAGRLTLSQKRETRVANETFFVLCGDEGGLPVSWRGPKGPLGPRTRPMVLSAPRGSRLIFQEVLVEDSGTYTCSINSEQEEFHLTVEAPLKFMDTSTNQTGIEGKDVTLRCEVEGGKVTWSVDGKVITDSEKYTVMGDGLLIRDVHRPDMKTYTCNAVHETTGRIVERNIKLKVLHKPYFPHKVYAKQEMVWGYVNGTVNLTCIVVADPHATFEWFKSSDRRHKIGVINEAADVSVLQLYIDKSAFGDYKCVASNSHGKLEQHFSLGEGAKPEPPTLLELRGANSNLLTLDIHPPDKTKEKGMEARGFRVQFRKNGDGEWDNRDFNITEDTTYPLDNLHHDTEYDIRAATRNAAGLSDYTNTSIFRTLRSQADCVHPTLPFFVMINSMATALIAYTSICW